VGGTPLVHAISVSGSCDHLISLLMGGLLLAQKMLLSSAGLKPGFSRGRLTSVYTFCMIDFSHRLKAVRTLGTQRLERNDESITNTIQFSHSESTAR
jgi:hypothetical protein